MTEGVVGWISDDVCAIKSCTCRNLQDLRERSSSGERPVRSGPVAGTAETWVPERHPVADRASAISPQAGLEPPVFPPSPNPERAYGGERQENVLLEVLNHCRFLHAAVQRLEQKIDHLQSHRCAPCGCRKQEVPEKGVARRLGSSPQTNYRWNPPWKWDPATRAPDGPQPDGCSGGTRRKGGCSKRRNHQGAGAKRGAPPEPPSAEEPPPKKEPAGDEEDKKVMIGSAVRKVWIPVSSYRQAFKEEEPQKAVVPVLHALFPISTLSCSAVTGDPLRGVQHLDANKLEALREWLAEMYPTHDLRVRGSAWARCLGVINRITDGLRRRGDSETPGRGGTLISAVVATPQPLQP